MNAKQCLNAGCRTKWTELYCWWRGVPVITNCRDSLEGSSLFLLMRERERRRENAKEKCLQNSDFLKPHCESLLAWKSLSPGRVCRQRLMVFLQRRPLRQTTLTLVTRLRQCLRHSDPRHPCSDKTTTSAPDACGGCWRRWCTIHVIWEAFKVDFVWAGNDRCNYGFDSDARWIRKKTPPSHQKIKRTPTNNLVESNFDWEQKKRWKIKDLCCCEYEGTLVKLFKGHCVCVWVRLFCVWRWTRLP